MVFQAAGPFDCRGFEQFRRFALLQHPELKLEHAVHPLISFHAAQMPTNPPTALRITPENENMLACHREGMQPPTVDPIVALIQIAFLLIPVQ